MRLSRHTPPVCIIKLGLTGHLFVPVMTALFRLLSFSAPTGALFLILAGIPGASAQAPTLVTELRTEHHADPVGIDVTTPRFSWKIKSSRRDVVQTAYQLRVARSTRDVQRGRNLLWDTGQVASDQSLYVPYGGPALVSGQRYHWQVRIWDDSGRASSWSTPAFWEMGLLNPSDWQAKWISPDWEEETNASQPAPLLRGEFRLSGRVASARAYVTSLGLYELYLNGRKVGDQVFTPGWTSYANQIQVQTYDVTDLLRTGENAVGAMLGDGWYRGYIGFQGQRNFYGDRLALLAQIVVTYADGQSETFGTNREWKATTGPILLSDIYNGETYDARLEKEGWTLTGYDATDWKGVRMLEAPDAKLVSPAGPPVRRIQEITPVDRLTTPEGDVVFDMGQNLVGRIRLRVEGPAGTTVTLRHAEVLDKDGNFYTANLRAAKQLVSYTLKGGGPEVYEPYFTFQGFRYVAIDGYPGEPPLDALTAVVIHSDMKPAGRFETSDPLINQLQHNIVWGQKGNFLDVPTDCPQRDERLGWTGDAQVFLRTAAFNYDVAGFFEKWLADLAYDQYDNGSVPHVIPNVLAKDGRSSAGSAAWADAATVIPWDLYERYADRRLLERQYPSMKAWVDYIRGRAGDNFLWMGDAHFGDWLAFATTRSDYPGATTSKDLIATAYYARSAELVARAAEVLGQPDEARAYRELAEQVKEAFLREFVSPNGRIGEATQTAYVVALSFDLLPESLRQQAADRLAEDVRRFGHLTTGFVGAADLTHVLSTFGHLDVAYQLLARTDYPSWLYPVTRGATTIWERWDGLKPDGTFQSAGMNSFNHYAYGAVGDWMYRVMAGIRPDPNQPGYKHIRIEPRPGGTFTNVSASLDSPYGPVGSSWKLTDGRMVLEVNVPANTSATILLPGANAATTTESGLAIERASGVQNVRQEETGVRLQVGSGVYSFSWGM